MRRNVNIWDSLSYPTEFSQNDNLGVVEKWSRYRAQFIVKNAGCPISFRALKFPVTPPSPRPHPFQTASPKVRMDVP